jgi:uncharacterized protein
MKESFPAARIELDQLAGGPVEGTAELPADGRLWGLGEATLVDAPHLSYRAEPGGSGGVRVTGVLEARCGLTCRRCLRQLERPLRVELDLRFDPAVQPWDEEEGVYGLDPDSAILDLSAPLREELLFALPEYPECEGGCRGLCPRCGADLGDEECDCGSEEPDPRWDVLRRLTPEGRHTAADADD